MVFLFSRGGTMNNYEALMRYALEISGKALGNTAPNPMVGAVVLDKDGNLVGEGYHERAGQPHAEVNALNMAADKAKGGTIIVTLEPCSHYGRTPPCTQAIIKAGIAKAVVATLDPNPKVAGRGVKILREAGLEVQLGVLEAQAKRKNEVFFKWITKHMPFVAMKYAMTMDGKIATATGDSKWISCEAARCFAHKLRLTYDAILVGTNTVKLDNPELTCRMVKGRSPVRVILSNSLDFQVDSKVFLNDGVRTILATTSKNQELAAQFITQPNVELLIVAADANGYPEPGSLLQKLAQKNVTSLLVEGGSEIHAAFLQAGLVDKVYAVIAPKLIGGQKSKAPIGELGIELMRDSINLQEIHFEQLGSDLLLTGYIGG